MLTFNMCKDRFPSSWDGSRGLFFQCCATGTLSLLIQLLQHHKRHVSPPCSSWVFWLFLVIYCWLWMVFFNCIFKMLIAGIESSIFKIVRLRPAILLNSFMNSSNSSLDYLSCFHFFFPYRTKCCLQLMMIRFPKYPYPVSDFMENALIFNH